MIYVSKAEAITHYPIHNNFSKTCQKSFSCHFLIQQNSLWGLKTMAVALKLFVVLNTGKRRDDLSTSLIWKVFLSKSSFKDNLSSDSLMAYSLTLHWYLLRWNEFSTNFKTSFPQTSPPFPPGLMKEHMAIKTKFSKHVLILVL